MLRVTGYRQLLGLGIGLAWAALTGLRMVLGECGLLQICRLYESQEERQMDVSDLISGEQDMMLNRWEASQALSRWATGAPGKKRTENGGSEARLQRGCQSSHEGCS